VRGTIDLSHQINLRGISVIDLVVQIKGRNPRDKLNEQPRNHEISLVNFLVILDIKILEVYTTLGKS
jgi:hypothetical protein